MNKAVFDPLLYKEPKYATQFFFKLKITFFINEIIYFQGFSQNHQRSLCSRSRKSAWICSPNFFGWQLLQLFKSVITLTSLFVLLRWRSNSCFALSLRTTWKSRIKTPWSEFKRVKRIAIHSLPLAKYVNPRIQVMPKIHIREAEPKRLKKCKIIKTLMHVSWIDH